MKDTAKKPNFKMEAITESINGRILVFQCTAFKSNKFCQQSIVKIINLVGQWPEGPTVLKRKNYPTLLQFVRYNNTNQQQSEFLKSAVKDFLNLSSYQISSQITNNQIKIFSNQIFLSNSGKRASFWISQTNFDILFTILTKLESTHLLKKFQWISPQHQQLHSNQIEYGSQNFINIIERLSLQSMSEIIGIKNYDQKQFNQIEQSFHNVFSLVNYNYRYFYPPKDATRFLKKTSGVIILSKQQFKEQKSKKWAQAVLLESIFQLRPTFFVAEILSRSHGPLYLEKYVFSEKMYSSIEQIYFMGSIESFFHPDNLRNDLKYLTFISRIFPYFLNLKQSQQKIQKLRKEGIIEEQEQFNLNQNSKGFEQNSDSEQQVQIEGQKSQNEIAKLYKSSNKSLLLQIKRQLNKKLETIKKKKINKKGF